MKTLILTAALLLLTSIATFAQKYPSSDYSRAQEFIEQGDLSNALTYLNKHLGNYPDDNVALYWRSLIFSHDNYKEYAKALSDINNAIKFTPKKEAETLSAFYVARTNVYVVLDMLDKAESDLLTAQKLTPKNSDVLHELANFYFGRELYDKVESYCEKMLDIDETNVMALVGLGVVAVDRDKNYDKAISYYDKAIKLSPSYTIAYSNKASALYEQKRYREALDEIINAYNIDASTDMTIAGNIAIDEPNDVVRKMNILIKEQPENVDWYTARAFAYINLKEYDKAIEDYNKIGEIIGYIPMVYNNMASIYQSKGDYNAALHYADKAIEAAVSEDIIKDRPDLYVFRASINWGLKNYDNAFADCDTAIEFLPTYDIAYAMRGKGYRLQKQYDKALADFNEAIEIDSVYISVLLYRGRVLKTLGKAQEAKKDFETIVRIDTAISESNYGIFGLFELGRNQEAITLLNKILEKYPEKSAYNAACLYSLMNDKTNAVKYLETALKSGEQQDFYHIDWDDDLNNIRETPEFKALIKQYDNRGTFPASEKQDVTYIEKTTVVKLTKSNGIYEMPCEINGLKLKMFFDSGASDVTISSTEAGFMLKNDYLNSKDIVGTTSYLIADGSIAEGTVINLREVKVGDFVLKNVKATVVHNQNAPLLLGQTVLKRFANITIDNEKMELIIKYKEAE